jgi:hypothetical protein
MPKKQEKEKWIQGAVKPGHEELLRNYVGNTFGAAGFEKKTGKIDTRLVDKLATGKCPVCFGTVCVCPTKTTRKRAKNVRGLR